MSGHESLSFTSFLEMQPGTELGSSDWHRISQADINEFAKLTRDEDEYHVNPEWARQHSSVGTTISFGFLTLSMLTFFSHQVFAAIGVEPGDDTQLFNFGFNRVRMPEPVPAGARIRGHFSFGGAKTRDAGGVEITVKAVVEIEGNDRPAVVADWLFVAVTAGVTG